MPRALACRAASWPCSNLPVGLLARPPLEVLGIGLARRGSLSVSLSPCRPFLMRGDYDSRAAVSNPLYFSDLDGHFSSVDW